MATSDALSVASNIICEGDQVMLQREKVLKVFQVRKQRTVWFERTKFTLDTVIGQEWGSMFDATSGKLQKVNREQLNQDAEKEMDESRDNRNLVDRDDNQKLTREEIHSMKNKGATGQDIVENLIENSATFSKKTEFAQQKYIKKKKKKHTTMFTVLKPNLRLLAKMYYSRGPTKICNLRIDAIGQLLTYSNVHSGSRVMVAEGCIGLLLGAVMDRLQGSGEIVQFYTGTAPVRSALENFDHPKSYYTGVHAYPISKLAHVRKLETADTSEPTAKCNDSEVNDSQVKDCDGERVVNCDSGNPTQQVPEASSVTENNVGTDNAVPTKDTAEGTDMDTTESTKEDTADTKNASPGTNEVQDNQSKDKDRSQKRKQEDEEREEKRQAKQAAHARTEALLLGRDMDALLVALRCHPTPVVLHLIRYLAPSRPFVVFCQYKEPLLDCYMQLRDQGGVINLRLAETWLRNYQVLSNRTHPEINMSGSGGYLLTGTTVKDA